MFNRLCLAFAFSPRAEALVCEAVRLAKIFDGHLAVLHVGECSVEEKDQIAALVSKHGLSQNQFNIICESGSPSKVILSICKREKIDLLIAGALQKENIIKYYLGTIGRTILRKADCSVLMLTHPNENGIELNNIVTLAEDSPYVEQAIAVSSKLAHSVNAKWLHIVRELKMLGLTLSAMDQSTENEYDQEKHHLIREEIDYVEEILKKLPQNDVKVNIKVISGKSGFELARFAEKKNADLLVVGAPERRFHFFDRLFTHDLEYIFANMPCNLLIVNKKQHAG